MFPKESKTFNSRWPPAPFQIGDGDGGLSAVSQPPSLHSKCVSDAVPPLPAELGPGPSTKPRGKIGKKQKQKQPISVFFSTDSSLLLQTQAQNTFNAGGLREELWPAGGPR